MFKKHFTFMITFSIISTLVAMEPHIKESKEIIERDGTQYIKNTHNIYFQNAAMRYVTLNKKGEKKLIKQKWGDYFLGLELGRSKYFKNSWNMWNFFECYILKDGKHQNVTQMFLPESVYITHFNDKTLAEIVSPLSDDGKNGKMTMRIMQFPSHKDWIFIRVKFVDSDIAPWRFTFSAYPAYSDCPKTRERWIATKENKYCVSKDKYSFTPTSNALVMFNKFAQEDVGDFMVFEADKFNKVYLNKSNNGVLIYFFPRKNNREFKFALGCFIDKSPADELPRFLGETQDNIYRFMENIDWEPKLNNSEFEKGCTDTD